jgi:hypothetical protein
MKFGILLFSQNQSRNASHEISRENKKICSVPFLLSNVGKFGRSEQATNGSIIRHMRCA